MAECQIVILADPAATEALGATLAGLARPGDSILLSGPIGAGKTTLVRAWLRAAAADPALEVPSPTFTLVQSYDLPGGRRAHHLDLWRLSGPEALLELGWEDVLRDIVLVEWPDRLADWRPVDALSIDLVPVSETVRHASISGWSDRLEGRV